MTLPSGWTIEASADEEQEQGALPAGWKVESSPKKAKERDEAKLLKEAGPFQVEEKTPEQIKNLSVSEKMQYAQDINRQREMIQSSIFSKNALSGLTFGLSENVESLKPPEFEETNPYSIVGGTGQVTGSLVPLTGLMKVFSGPATKLASKSPVFQKQLSSLATMFGVGATDKALHELAKGEIPSADDVLEHGFEWAALDGLLQTAGVAGRFAKSLFARSNATGIPRTNLINNLNKELAESGIDMNNAEAVSKKALEILEAPLTEADQATSRRLQMPQKAESPIEKVAQEAIKPEKISPKDLKSRKVEEDPVNKLTSETHVLAEPYQPEGIDFTKEAEAIEKNAIQEQIDSVGTKAETSQQLGNSIKEDIEAQLEARKEEYRPLYAQAEEAAGHLTHVPQNTANTAGNRLKKISRLSTKPQGYNTVIKTLENVLEDAGFIIQRDEGAVELIISNKEVPVENTMELARRLNEIIDYEAVEPSVKDALRSVARAAKQDVRAGLASNPDALAAFELAEQAHAQTAKRFSTDTVRKIRGQDAGEKISKMAESPSTFGELKEVLSPQQFLQLEREMLEKLNSQNYEKAQKTLKDIERHISADNRKLAREIVESKNPHNPLARKKLTQDAILNDMSASLTNGTRPEKTLALWKTPKGQNLVKETFNNSPNWPQVKEYLEKQSFNDMLSSVIKDGKIDIKKFKSFMRDPVTVNNIRSAGGEEAVTFFRNLESNVKKFEENVKLLDRFPTFSDINRGKEIIKRIKKKAFQKPKSAQVGQEALETLRMRQKESSGERGKKILERMAEKDFPFAAKSKKWKEWFSETLGLTPKAALSVFGLMKFGLPSTVASMLGFRMFNKMLTSSKARSAFIDATKHHPSPIKFMLAIEHLGDILDE